MWYIDAMILKGLAIFAVLLAIAPVPLAAQATSHPAAPQQFQPKPDCNGIPCEDQQPRFIVTMPSPTPTPWPMHDRILWAALLVLAILGYVGIMLAMSTLKKIERNTSVAEAAAAAAADIAQAALLHAQAIVNAERPWVLITAERTRGVESSFEITATNRGRSPATIVAALDQILFAADEAQLNKAPEFKRVESGARFVPNILLPGEAATLKSFRREDVRGLCESDERFASVESWSERIFLCGKVIYKDLIAPAGKEDHATNWCCWYIHGKHKSALVPAGGAEHNSHT